MNNLYLEVHRAASVILRSKDVIHSFYLPHFRVKQDAMPGMRIPIWFVPTEVGEFEIACAELCGLAHYRMKGKVHVLSKEGYRDWLAGTVRASREATGQEVAR
jgi:cytochrome c oxidase subunit 2